MEAEYLNLISREKDRDYANVSPGFFSAFFFEWGVLTVPFWMCPGHQAIAGSLMPPSNVVSFPHRNGPLLPPEGVEV